MRVADQPEPMGLRGHATSTPCENSRLSDDLDVIVKSLALNSCKENS